MEAVADLVAGRELDALMAEKVMGLWRHPSHPDIEGPVYRERGGGQLMTLPAYSTDIAAAWMVAEHLRTVGWEVEVKDHNVAFPAQGPWFALFARPTEGWGSPIGAGLAETAPLAICRAALAAVEHR